MSNSSNSTLRIAVVFGYWGSNIGNAFFNLGGKYFISKVFGYNAVDFISDQPGYYTFNNQKKGNPINDFGLLSRLNVDYLVIQGPIFTETLLELWGDTFEKLVKRGTKI